MRRARSNPPTIGNRGVVTSERPMTELDHYLECGECGHMIDLRDLGEVFEHEGPHLPPLPS